MMKYVYERIRLLEILTVVRRTVKDGLNPLLLCKIGIYVCLHNRHERLFEY